MKAYHDSEKRRELGRKMDALWESVRICDLKIASPRYDWKEKRAEYEKKVQLQEEWNELQKRLREEAAA